MSHRVIACVVGGLGLSALLSCSAQAGGGSATSADTVALSDSGGSATDNGDVVTPVGDEDGGSAPGGTTDAEGADAGSPKLCINPNDLNAIQSKSPRSTLKDCLLRCYTATDRDTCTADCMDTTSNLTTPCTDCFTNMLDCLLAHCYAECDPQAETTAKCGDCGRANGCVDRFSGCAGLTPPK